MFVVDLSQVVCTFFLQTGVDLGLQCVCSALGPNSAFYLMSDMAHPGAFPTSATHGPYKQASVSSYAASVIPSNMAWLATQQAKLPQTLQSAHNVSLRIAILRDYRGSIAR